MRTLSALALALLLVGCRHARYAGFSRQSGDVVPFALARAIDFGARPQSTNALPVIQADWKFKADSRGIQIYINGDHFKDISTFLSRTFGEPDPSKGSKPADFREGRPDKWFGWYSAPDIGVVIQYFGNDKDCGMIILGPPKP